MKRCNIAGGDTIRVLPPLVMTLEQAGELGAGIVTFSTTSPAKKTTHDCAKTLSHPMDLAPDEIRALIARAIELKTQHRAGTAPRSLEGKVLAMILTKASTRTRVFEAGMAQLGGSAVSIGARHTNGARRTD